jgi:putative transposase
MRYDSGQHHRRSMRLKGYDYAQVGAYFVTVCVRNRECLFGEAVNGEMRLNDWGQIATACWREIAYHFPAVELDVFVFMPNHMHGIVVLTNVGARHAVPLPNTEQFGKPVSGSLPTIIRSFKSATTKRINEMRRTLGAPIWQRNYYEHIVRNEQELACIREYIATNSLHWALDRENPDLIAPLTEEDYYRKIWEGA